MTGHPRRLGFALAAGLLVAAAVLAPAQDTTDAAAGAAAEAATAAAAGQAGGLLGGFGLSMGVGAAAFNDVVDGTLVTTTYQTISLSPDLAFGKFGLSLDITLHVNFSGGATGDKYIRTEDWVPVEFKDPAATGGEKAAALAELYLGKFRYVRWGLRGEPLYVKFGMIEDGSLGNGFLIGQYANTLYLPETRIMGVAFGLDGSLFKFPLIGVEALLGNIARFDVMGGRLYVRPLSFTTVPVLKDLTVGASIVVDRDPYLYGDGDATQELTASPVVAMGVDLQQPIVSKPMVSLVAMADWGMLTTTPAAGTSDSGVGAMIGVGGRLVKFLTYGAQLRIIGSRFVPIYFDSMYDLGRAERYRLLISETEVAPAFAGWMGSIGTSFLNDNIVFLLSASGPFGYPVLIGGEPVVGNELNWPEVKGLIQVGGDFLRGFSFLASYDKKNIMTLRDFISPEDALIQARVNYQTGPAVISFVYNLKYLAEPVGDTNWVVTSGLETSIQLF